MPIRESRAKVAEKLQYRRTDLLERLDLTERTWAELQERQIEYEERAANDTLSVPLADLSEQDYRELLRIDKALLKIAENTYGFCESCGRPISPARLGLLPEAEWCVECATRLERAPVPEAAEGEAGPIALPNELEGLEDGELASRVYDAIRYARIVAIEELRINCKHGVVRLTGYLPSEKEHRVLLQYLTDTLGITALEDHLLDDRILWENQRTSGRQTEPPGIYDIVAEGAGEPVPDVTEAQTNGLPMDAPDELIPENEPRRSR